VNASLAVKILRKRKKITQHIEINFHHNYLISRIKKQLQTAQ
jgi:hypothetical protein